MSPLTLFLSTSSDSEPIQCLKLRENSKGVTNLHQLERNRVKLKDLWAQYRIHCNHNLGDAFVVGLIQSNIVNARDFVELATQ